MNLQSTLALYAGGPGSGRHKELASMLDEARSEWHKKASGHGGQARWSTEHHIARNIGEDKIELHIGRPRVSHAARARYSSGPERWKKNGAAIKYSDLVSSLQ